MTGPTAAPNRWPYRDHRTVEDIDNLTPRNGRPRDDADRAGNAIVDPKRMAKASALFVSAIIRERAA